MVRRRHTYRILRSGTLVATKDFYPCQKKGLQQTLLPYIPLSSGNVGPHPQAAALTTCGAHRSKFNNPAILWLVFSDRDQPAQFVWQHSSY